MAKMTIMHGLPACGKSTRAKEILATSGNTVRINKDLLREMLHFDKFNYHNEKKTQEASKALAQYFLANNVNVVIDDTNLNPSIMDTWHIIAKEHNARIEHVDMTSEAIYTCIQRDKNREKKVGASVIYKMALEHLDFWSGQRVILCDLDGTICDVAHRRHYVNGDGPKDWKGFFSKMSEDAPRKQVIEQVLKLSGSENCPVVFVSARPEEYRGVTEEWLNKNIADNLPFDYMLIMRNSNDSRSDTLVKKEIYDRYLKNMNIVKVFDDRPSVIRMWLELGLEVVDVGDGVEF